MIFPLRTACRYIPLMLLLLSACSPSPTPEPLPTVTLSPTFTGTALPTSTSTSTPSLTPEPAWYQQIDSSYSEMKYRYGLVDSPSARRYASLADALSGTGNYDLLPIVPAYVAILGEETKDDRTFFQFNYGWMESSHIQLLTPSSLRGLLLTRQVDFRFGWVLADTVSTNAVGLPIQEYHRYQVIQEVPAVTENPGYFAVGPDEWLPLEVVALTDANLPVEAGPDTCHFIHVDLTSQVLRVYHDCSLVFTTLVSTGREPRWTFPGRFSIQTWFEFMQLTAPSWSTSVYYQEAVPTFMGYYGDLGFHGAYWHDDFGMPVSHGCINMSPADARWLYEWAQDWMGATVIITEDE